ncbi:MAG: DUF2510 domain-containing protein [Acidobacteriota bacterium]
MQEFSSVTASSYDAESLAPLLNEKAADGWSVVSIVAAGTNIVAYLQRDTDGAATEPESTEPVAESTEATAEVAAEPAADEAPAAVDEPAGWASAPEETPAEEAPAAAAEPSVDDLAAQVSEPEAAPEPEPVAEAAPAVESAVPAGWYADPSGRFELRYWDGTAWTEHVSRAGQQFTDPPVA